MNTKQFRFLWRKFLFPDMPEAATLEDWKLWQRDKKAKSPIRFWLAEEMWHWLHRVTFGNVEKCNQWFHKIRNKNHIIELNIPPGEYHASEVMLRANFEVLRKYVENDKAWQNHISNFVFEDAGYSEKLVKDSHYIWKHSPKIDYAMEYLEWEISLDKDTTDEESQSYIAKEIKELYTWWVYDRPSRIDPFENADYLAYIKMRENRGAKIDNVFIDYDENSPEEQELEDKAIQTTIGLEESYLTEDELMLSRLIKIRRYLYS